MVVWCELMNLHPTKLVTIICEALAREPVTRLLDEVGAHGYTLFTVEGRGAKGDRLGDIQEFANIQIDAIVQEKVATRLLERLEREFFPRYAMIAYEKDVRVLRRDKF
jgi:nitrogen regulatory protein P-II 2